jgi:hypothetical protein
MRGRIERAVFDALPPASQFAPGITVREIATAAALSETQVRAALWRLRERRMAFCFDTDERGAGVWERTRATPASDEKEAS